MKSTVYKTKRSVGNMCQAEYFAKTYNCAFFLHLPDLTSQPSFIYMNAVLSTKHLQHAKKYLVGSMKWGLSFPLPLSSLFSSISNFQANPHSERQAQQGSTEHNLPPCCNSCFWSAMYHYWELHVVICVLWPDVFWGGRWRRGWSQMKSSRAQVQTHSHLGLLPAEHGRHHGLMLQELQYEMMLDERTWQSWRENNIVIIFFGKMRRYKGKYAKRELWEWDKREEKWEWRNDIHM